MNRPLDGETPRNRLIAVRVEEDEHDRWKAAASKAGQSLSAWIRGLANRAAEKATSSKKTTRKPKGDR